MTMGDSAENRNLDVHGGLEGGFQVKMTRHFGALTSTSPTSSNRDAWRAFRDAVLQGAPSTTVDPLGFALWGSWWLQQGTAGQGGRQAAYDAVLDAAA